MKYLVELTGWWKNNSRFNFQFTHEDYYNISWECWFLRTLISLLEKTNKNKRIARWILTPVRFVPFEEGNCFRNFLTPFPRRNHDVVRILFPRTLNLYSASSMRDHILNLSFHKFAHQTEWQSHRFKWCMPCVSNSITRKHLIPDASNLF